MIPIHPGWDDERCSTCGSRMFPARIHVLDATRQEFPGPVRLPVAFCFRCNLWKQVAPIPENRGHWHRLSLHTPERPSWFRKFLNVWRKK